MKRICIGLITLALLVMTGSNGLNAQGNRGNQYLKNQSGACINSNALSSEQKGEIQRLSLAHRAEMDVLSAELRSTNTLAQRSTIREQMDQIQAAHRKNIIELGATPANTPHSRFLGRGQGAGMGARGGAGLGNRRTSGSGRGLGPCGAGLGR